MAFSIGTIRGLSRREHALLSALTANGVLRIDTKRDHIFVAATEQLQNSVINCGPVRSVCLCPHFGADLIELF
jgi:hypothetical protein